MPDEKPQPPFIIAHEVDGDRGILVTWSLPGLRRATVRVPVDAWLNGDHVTLGSALADHPSNVLIQPDADVDQADDD